MSFLDNSFDRIQLQLEKLCEQRESYEREKQNLINEINKSSFDSNEQQIALIEIEQKQQDLNRQIQKYSHQLDVLRRIFIVSEQVKELEIDCGVDSLLHNALIGALIPTTFDELNKKNLAYKLPQYQQVQREIVANYEKEYSLYQGQQLGQKSISYYATVFIAFGRPFYLKVCQRYHADCGGSDEIMKFVNVAWDIAQDYLEKQAIAKIA